MIAFLELESIRELFFLAVRFVVALAGFAVGYFLTGPLVQLTAWLFRRRQLPDWVVGFLRVTVGILVALIVFYLVPIGGTGLGGGGSGGGLGEGQGSGKEGGPGTGTATSTASIGIDTRTTGKGLTTKGALVVAMLGPGTAEGDKCYRLDPKGAPVNWETLKSHIESQRAQIESIVIVITEQSVSRNDPLVEQLQQLAQKLGIPSVIKAS
jgi:hypothetical protein